MMDLKALYLLENDFYPLFCPTFHYSSDSTENIAKKQFDHPPWRDRNTEILNWRGGIKS